MCLAIAGRAACIVVANRTISLPSMLETHSMASVHPDVFFTTQFYRDHRTVDPLIH